MIKKLDEIAVGDWVLLNSPVSSNVLSLPWKIAEIRDHRVDLEQYRTDTRSGSQLLEETKSTKVSAIRFAFTDEASARSLADYAHTLGKEFDAQVEALTEQVQQRLQIRLETMKIQEAFAVGLPVNALETMPEEERAAMAKALDIVGADPESSKPGNITVKGVFADALVRRVCDTAELYARHHGHEVTVRQAGGLELCWPGFSMEGTGVRTVVHAAVQALRDTTVDKKAEAQASQEQGTLDEESLEKRMQAIAKKIKWQVGTVPTGRYRSFEHRSWPSASYKDDHETHCAGIFCEDSYSPALAKSGNHQPLVLRVADYSQGSFIARKLKARFTTVDDAKLAVVRFLALHAEFMPQHIRDEIMADERKQAARKKRAP